MTGETPSETGSSVPAHYVLLVTGRRFAWLVLDGVGWKRADRATLRVVTDHLKALKPA